MLRVGLLGCGGVTRRYRRTYSGLPGVRVTVTVDVNLAEAKDAGAELNAGRASDDPADAFARDVDAVIISTPNYLHAAHAVAALNAGKHVLLQKPMARSVAECDEIIEAWRRSGRTLGLYMNLLDHPLFRDIRRLVKEDRLGSIAIFSARLAHRGGLSWGGADRNWRASRMNTGGGSFIQLGVHYQHLMRWLTGQQVTAVEAVSTNFACPHLEGDDIMMAHYRLSGGTLGEIQTSWCCMEEHVSLLGTKGSIHYRDNQRVEFLSDTGPFQGEILSVQGNGTLETFDNCLPPEWDDARNPWNQHRRFCEALQQGIAPDVSPAEGREDVRLVQACYAAAERFGA